MLDSDLASLYKVETRVLNQAVKRNIYRFPEDFMFQLSDEEWKYLKSQSVTSSWGGRRKLPNVFTEHGSIMLASILNSKEAVQASIFVVRAFVKLRSLLSQNKELAKKIEQLEKKSDMQFRVIFETLKKLTTDNKDSRKTIGYKN